MDNWGIKSHTLDLNYHWQFDDQGFFEPHFRFYHQTQADFYTAGLISGDALPLYASADQRLAAFNASPLDYGTVRCIEGGSLFAIRLEYYTQLGNQHPANVVGIQQTFNLAPALQAIISRFSTALIPPASSVICLRHDPYRLPKHSTRPALN